MVLLRNLILQHFDLGLEAFIIVDEISVSRHALLQIERLFVHGIAVGAIIPQFFLQLRNLDFLALD